MIFCIFGGGEMPSPMGCAEGLAPCLLGNFQRYIVLRLGKFPNKLRYFLRKYPAVCRPSAFRRWLSLPSAYPYNPTLLFFPFGRWWAVGRSFPFSKALLHGAVGYKVFPINTLAAKREEDLSGNGAAPDLLADIKPRACFAFVNGNDCSAFL